ncbi:MAG: glycosyltransferase family 4 protein [Sedimentisphaerales bacterium]|nr:glycosyltransferase family 4 protein [Sedimentisphaerales bacterium]
MTYQQKDPKPSLLKNISASFSLKPYRDVLFVSEGIEWVTSREIRGLVSVTNKLGIPSRHSGPLRIGLPRQSIFMPSAYFLKHPCPYFIAKNRIAFPFYHGYLPSTSPLITACHKNLKKYHNRITRIQASHSYMRDLILESGIDPKKVFLIPIAIDGRFFSPQTPESKKTSRQEYGIPQQAVVAGSFQKDGEGWGDGMKPKLVKGPDVFLKTIESLKASVPELFVLLSGPARGFVKKGLDKLNVPYKHVYFENYSDINQLYHCLDLYIIASRQEGGPKAVLEAMACGVPLVTTRVGQAMDLVNHQENGLMVEPEDIEGLVFWSNKVFGDSELRNKIIKKGFVTAKENTYMAHTDRWRQFFKGFVDNEL